MYIKPKGTQDILPNDVYTWQTLENIIHRIASIYNYEEIRTPIFESTELFHRSAGEESDIVTKETYDFQDRSGRLNTLRPEGTAGVIRSVIENKLYASPVMPQKLYYVGPMFRYERPQKGRQRQFHQFGAELIGSYSPLADGEVISYAYSLIEALKLKDITVYINSLGDKESQENYKKALVEYLSNNVSSLCEDCQRRFSTNPLRILDCKVDAKSELFNDLPHPIDYLTDNDKAHFDKVLEYLDVMKIPYKIDHKLVRGLDYYTHTIFEIKASLSGLGTQDTLGGGGRYNNLIKELGGPEMGACGFAFGMERLIIALEALRKNEVSNFIHLYMIALGDKANLKALEIITKARKIGLTAEMSYEQGSLKNQFKQSEKLNSLYIMVLGDNELLEGEAVLKNTETKEEMKIKIADIYKTIIHDLQKGESNCGSCHGGCNHEENSK